MTVPINAPTAPAGRVLCYSSASVEELTRQGRAWEFDEQFLLNCLLSWEQQVGLALSLALYYGQNPIDMATLTWALEHRWLRVVGYHKAWVELQFTTEGIHYCHIVRDLSQTSGTRPTT